MKKLKFLTDLPQLQKCICVLFLLCVCVDVYLDVCVCVCVKAHSGECVLYANFVNVYKLLQPILIRFSLVSFMEMHGDYSAEHRLRKLGCLTVNRAVSSQ